jgi:general stress protein YciG
MSITVVEAGRKGGLTVLNKRGREFFSEIGRKGQQVMRAKYPSMASVWGKQGGRPKKFNLDINMGEQGIK